MRHRGHGTHPRPVARRGFTLVEVLVALTIVAVALAAGVRASASLTDGAQRLAEVTAAQWCADNQLSVMRITRQFPGIGESAFDCEQLGRRYSGQLSTTPLPADADLRLVSAAVLDDQGHVLVRLVTVLSRY